jgi:hypothetical protein
MASPVYTYTTIFDEVKAALNLETTGITSIPEAVIMRIAYRHIVGNESTYAAQKVATGIYKSNIGYGYWLLPTFDGEDDVEYTINSTGSIEVTSGTHSTDSITVTATSVNFCMLMVDILRYIADNFAKTAAQSMGSTSISPQTVRAECMRQASHWASEHFLDR